jgi:Protein of unknown function (DUF3048) N-terminal domain/Protein of unknown function (DUF3048) C-terminal domain
VTDTPSESSTGTPRRRAVPLWKQRRYQIGAGICALVLVVGTIVVVAQGDGDDVVSTTSAAMTSTSTTVGRTTTTLYSGPVAPLTGIPDPAGATQSRAAITVKIDNTLREGPKRGLDQADVVYEEVVEGGLTRLAAVFHSNVPDAIGPIRSVRLTDQAIVRPIGGVFVYSGGARYAEESIATAPVVLVDESAAGDAMYRDPDRGRPHNLFGRAVALFAFGGDPTPPHPLFTYRPSGEAAIGGVPIREAFVGFDAGFDVTWNWDAASGTWHRTFLGEQEFVDGGAPIAPKNVIVQFVDYVGGSTPEAVMTGEGDVWVLTDGRAFSGRWKRSTPEDPGVLVDTNGEPILLSPGQTWVELPETGYEFRVG